MKRSKSITRKMFRGATIVLTVAELSGAATALIDGILTARFLGEHSLAAQGIASPYFSLACIISGILMVGCQNITVRRVAQGKIREANRAYSITVLVGILTSLLVSICGIIFAENLAVLFGATGESRDLIGEAAGYLRGVFIGMPFWTLFFILTPILQIDGKGRLATIASIVMCVSDVAADLLNIFVFKAGMFGMGFATAFSHIAGALTLCIYVFDKKRIFRFRFLRFRFKELVEILKDGVPRLTSMTGRILGPIAINFITVLTAGTVGMTALSAQRNITFIFNALGWGIGGAVLMLTEMYFSEQNKREMKRVLRHTMEYILFGVETIMVILICIAPLIATGFTDSEGPVREMATHAIRWFALSLPFVAFNVAMANYFQAEGRPLAANIVNFSTECAALVVAIFTLSQLIGTEGIWIGFFAGEAFLSLLIFLFMQFNKKKSNEREYRYLMLPPGFGVSDKDMLTKKLYTMEDVTDFAQKVSAFCEAHELSPKETYGISLCVEEMAGNVIEHGFSDGKDHILEVTVIVAKDLTLISLRDDCKRFDLKQKIENWKLDPEHPEANLGIRIVTNLSKDIRYSNTMNINNLQIRL